VTAPEVELGRAWRRLVGTARGRAADAAFDSLLARHREPHRRYHTATHVMWVLRHVDDLATRVDRSDGFDLDAVRAAALFHDAVYNPRSSTNEADSAVLAGDVLTDLGWAAARVERVQQLISATAGHVDATDASSTGTDVDILLDADLAILGAEPNEYSAYVAGVRAEYGHVDAAEWRAGRSAVLQQFVDRTTIYRTRAMRDAREQRARANLTAELATLTPNAPEPGQESQSGTAGP
jgi:predicted metal-dependent HD superfamily phosphohydrolase